MVFSPSQPQAQVGQPQAQVGQPQTQVGQPRRCQAGTDCNLQQLDEIAFFLVFLSFQNYF